VGATASPCSDAVHVQGHRTVESSVSTVSYVLRAANLAARITQVDDGIIAVMPRADTFEGRSPGLVASRVAIEDRREINRFAMASQLH
jgi:hypothetical protein